MSLGGISQKPPRAFAGGDGRTTTIRLPTDNKAPGRACNDEKAAILSSISGECGRFLTDLRNRYGDTLDYAGVANSSLTSVSSLGTQDSPLPLQVVEAVDRALSLLRPAMTAFDPATRKTEADRQPVGDRDWSTSSSEGSDTLARRRSRSLNDRFKQPDDNGQVVNQQTAPTRQRVEACTSPMSQTSKESRYFTVNKWRTGLNSEPRCSPTPVPLNRQLVHNTDVSMESVVAVQPPGLRPTALSPPPRSRSREAATTLEAPPPGNVKIVMLMFVIEVWLKCIEATTTEKGHKISR